MVVVLNSDCRVEPGWDVALYEAASDGRRVAFPFTDHCDGLGFTRPDQGGTAGWCFMLTKELYDEVGVFDEWFNPAFGEDTDYWHRAWEMGVELSPVPAARVVHARRTTANMDPRVDMLLQGHRYKYGWKHGVDPHRAPPYYERDIVDYQGSYRVPRRSRRKPAGPATRLRHRPEQDGNLLVARRVDDARATRASTGVGRRSVSSWRWPSRPGSRSCHASMLASMRSPTSRCSRSTSTCSTASTRAAASCSPSGRSTTGSTADAVTSRTTSVARRPVSTPGVPRGGRAAGARNGRSTCERVRSLFAGRDDFLELDLATDRGLGAVCSSSALPYPGGTVPVAANSTDLAERGPFMRLILHIGMSKTGTSTLQATLNANAQLLAASGVLYPKPKFGKVNHNYLTTLVHPMEKIQREFTSGGHDFESIRARGSEFWQDLQRQVKRSKADIVVLSGEYIYGLGDRCSTRCVACSSSSRTTSTSSATCVIRPRTTCR